MTDNGGTPPEAAIIEQIIGDARAQAKRLVDNAALSVTAEEKKTERETATFEEFIEVALDVAPDLMGPHHEGARFNFKRVIDLMPADGR